MFDTFSKIVRCKYGNIIINGRLLHSFYRFPRVFVGCIFGRIVECILNHFHNTLEAFPKHFRSIIGSIFEAFSMHYDRSFGCMLDAFSKHVGIISTSFWMHFESIFEAFPKLLGSHQNLHSEHTRANSLHIHNTLLPPFEQPHGPLGPPLGDPVCIRGLIL